MRRFEKLKQEIASSRTHFRNVIERNVDGIIVVDRQGVIQYLNPAAEALFGKVREEIIGQDFGIPRDLDVPVEINFQPDREGSGTGEMRAVETEWEGREAILFSVRDIADRKRAEREILELNETLEAKIQKRTEQLESVNRELEAFNYAVSHDLRTPLARIDGYAALLIGDLEDRIDQEHAGYLERIRASVGDMVELTNGLLQLSRLNRVKMEIRTVDLSSVATRIFDNLKAESPGRNVNISVAPDLKTEGDLVLLRATLENLLSNAWKFTRARDPALIEFSSCVDEHDTVFFVRDNGAGFDMARADELFLAFQRLHEQSAFQGTGVGLTTVQRIVSRHGGRIWAEAQVDQGATFFFTLGPGTTD